MSVLGGISDSRSVTVGCPEDSPRNRSLSPSPCPAPIGAMPWRSGSAKSTCRRRHRWCPSAGTASCSRRSASVGRRRTPSRRARNSAEHPDLADEGEPCCPQFRDGKMPTRAMTKLSARIRLACSRAAGCRPRCDARRRAARLGGRRVAVGCAAASPGCRPPAGGRRCAEDRPTGACARASRLTVSVWSPRRPPAHMNPFPTCTACGPEVGQREVGLAVAAVRGAEQREQRLVLVDRQELAVAERPALGREVEADDLDFAEKGSCPWRVLASGLARGRCRTAR